MTRSWGVLHRVDNVNILCCLVAVWDVVTECSIDCIKPVLIVRVPVISILQRIYTHIDQDQAEMQ